MVTLRKQMCRVDFKEVWMLQTAEVEYIVHNTAALLFNNALTQCIRMFSATPEELPPLFSQ